MRPTPHLERPTLFCRQVTDLPMEPPPAGGFGPATLLRLQAAALDCEGWLVENVGTLCDPRVRLAYGEPNR